MDGERWPFLDRRAIPLWDAQHRHRPFRGRGAAWPILEQDLVERHSTVAWLLIGNVLFTGRVREYKKTGGLLEDG